MTTKSNSPGNQKESSTKSTQGGSHEQHVKAGQQSHKDASSSEKRSSSTDQNRTRS